MGQKQTLEHGASLEKRTSGMNENSIRFKMKVHSSERIYVFLVQIWRDCFLLHMLNYRAAIGASIVVSESHNLMKNDKAVSSYKHHEISARHKQNLNSIKMMRKQEITGKGTVKSQITESNQSTNKAERLRN